MFLTEFVPALFKKGTLKLAEAEEGYRRVAEATLMIEPFPVNLAREMGEEIASHLFDDNGAIRNELESIALNVRAGLQRVTVRHDQALEPIVVLDTASIKDVKATVIEDKKSNRRWMSFTFVVVFSLENRAARNFVLDEFGKTLLWTFEALQGDLLRKADMHDAIANLVDTGLTSISSASPDGSSLTTEVDPASASKHREAARTLRKAARVN